MMNINMCKNNIEINLILWYNFIIVNFRQKRDSYEGVSGILL